MPLSKKRVEWMRNYRASVIPSVIPKLEAWEVTNWRDIDIEANPHLRARIPNYPDGSYRG